MKVINQKGGDFFIFDKIEAHAKKRTIELKEKKAQLLQVILSEWKQAASVNFWRKCFNFLDYKIIKMVYDNINDLVRNGYAIKNPAAFFVHTIKEMGHYPFNMEDKNEKKKK